MLLCKRTNMRSLFGAEITCMVLLDLQISLFPCLVSRDKGNAVSVIYKHARTPECFLRPSLIPFYLVNSSNRMHYIKTRVLMCNPLLCISNDEDENNREKEMLVDTIILTDV